MPRTLNAILHPSGKKDRNTRSYFLVPRLHGIWNRGHAFTWQAPNNSAITISFPPGRVNDPLGIGTVTLQPGKKLTRQLDGTTSSQSLQAISEGSPYSYTIFHHESRTYVRCHSEPEIIIDKR